RSSARSAPPGLGVLNESRAAAFRTLDEKAPAGRAGGREGPDLRGDEEAWIGRPTGEDRPDFSARGALSSSGRRSWRGTRRLATARSTAHGMPSAQVRRTGGG